MEIVQKKFSGHQSSKWWFSFHWGSFSPIFIRVRTEYVCISFLALMNRGEEGMISIESLVLDNKQPFT